MKMLQNKVLQNWILNFGNFWRVQKLSVTKLQYCKITAAELNVAKRSVPNENTTKLNGAKLNIAKSFLVKKSTTPFTSSFISSTTKKLRQKSNLDPSLFFTPHPNAKSHFSHSALENIFSSVNWIKAFPVQYFLMSGKTSVFILPPALTTTDIKISNTKRHRAELGNLRLEAASFKYSTRCQIHY